MYKINQQILTNDDKLLLNEIQKKNNVDITDKFAKQWVLCRSNPLYFILNYVYLPEVGGMFKYSSDKLHPKFRRVIRSVNKYNNVLLMASRQLGKALSLETHIPLFDGSFKLMKDIQVGDRVLSPTQEYVYVCAKTNVMYNHNCYEIEFDCGEKIIADEDHLWKVNTRSLHSVVITTKNIYDYIQEFGYNNISLCFTDIKIKNIKRTDSAPVQCIQVTSSDGMYLCGKNKIPTHNSSISACLLAWALNFFPNNKAIILN